MKGTSTRNQQALLLFTLLVFGFIAPLASDNNNQNTSLNMEISDIGTASVVEYLDHSPIVIEDNDDFEDGDWTGEGTELSPYTLTNYKFNTTGTGIKIEGTNVFFKILNCLFVGTGSTIGISLEQAENGMIEDCQFDGINIGFKAEQFENLLVSGSTVSESTTGINLERTNDVTITSSNFSLLNTSLKCERVDNLTIESCEFQDFDYGLELALGEKIGLHNNSFEEGLVGILSEDYTNLSIEDSKFIDLQYATFCSDSMHILIQMNTFEECLQNIYASNCEFLEIMDNEIQDCNYGIYLTSVDLFNVTRNTITEASYDGVSTKSCTEGNITENIITNNERYGVNLVASTKMMIFGNEIGWNEEGNAIDSVGTLNFLPVNLWDDNSSIGNGYSDYLGTSTYVIAGSVGSVDRFPSSILYLAEPQDLTIETGEEGILEWEASALNPDSFEITINSELLQSGPWDGTMISIPIPDNLDTGDYLYSVLVNTTTNRILIDNVQVSIIDTTNPEWLDLPEDQVLEAGERISYSLQAEDLNGIETYWVNDTVNFEIDSTILKDTSVLSIGEYAIELRAYDPYDNYCSEVIIVNVTDTIYPEISSPDDIEYEFDSTENYIEWTFSDVNPATYTIYLDDDIVKEGLWNQTSETLLFNVDGLSVGTHVVTIAVIDEGGNYVSDEVLVTVTERTSTTTTETSSTITDTTTESSESTTDNTEPPSSLTTPLVILGIGSAGLIVTLMILSKKGILNR